MSPLVKNTYREILRSPGRFLAILAIIVLGSGFFVGLRVSQKAMTATADTYLARTGFYDYSVATTLGLAREDVEALREDPNVLEAEGGFQTDALVNFGENIDYVYTFYTLPSLVNTPDLLEGRLPETAGECLADSWSKLTPGTKIYLSGTNDEDTLDLFTVRELTVVGVCTSPLYLNFERGSTSLGSGSVASFCYVTPEAIDADYFTAVYLRCRDMPASYTAGYDARSEALEPVLTALAEKRADARYVSVVSDAESELADAEGEYNDAFKEYTDKRSDAESELSDAKAELDDARRELEDAAGEIEDGKKEIADGQKELDDNRTTLDDGKRELDDAERELTDAAREIEDGWREYGEGYEAAYGNTETLNDSRRQLNDARAELEDAARQIEDGKKEIADGWAELAENEQTLRDAKAELDDAARQIEDGKKELADGKAELAENEQTLLDARAELDSGKADLDDARAQLDEGWREYNDGVSELERQRADGEKQIADGKKELEDALETLNSGERQYESGLRDYRAGVAEYNSGMAELERGRAELERGEAEFNAQMDEIVSQFNGQATMLGYHFGNIEELVDALNTDTSLYGIVDGVKGAGTAQSIIDGYETGKATVEAGWAEYNAGKAELDAGAARLASASRQLDSARAELDDGWDEYNAGVKELEDAETQLADGIAQGEKTLADAKAELDAGEADYAEGLREYEDGEAAYQDGLAQYNDGKAKIEQAEADLADAETQYADGLADYEDGVRQWNDGKAELEQAEIDLADAERRYADGVKEYENGEAEYEEGYSQWADGFSRLTDAKERLEDAERQYAEGKADYEEGLREYEDGLRQWNDGKAELEQAEIDLADGIKEYADGLRDYEDGLAEYEDARREADREFADAEAELADARAELDDARAEIDDIEYPEVYLLGRWGNVGYACFESDSSIVRSISAVFPVFFFLVAALICVTTVSRMVEEQRSQLGVLMALGYSRMAVMGKFLAYSGAATVIGSVTGILLGSRVIPLVVWQAYKIMYSFSDEIEFYFDLPLAAGTFFAYLAAMLAVTWYSCRKELSDVPANVIRPKAPKAGKRVLLERVPIIWNRLSFLWKVTIRNIFRYKSRVFMMILGIAGCTALMITGMGINDSIKNVVDYQFTEVSLYDFTVTFSGHLDESQQRGFLEKTSSLSDNALFLHQSSFTASANRTEKEVYLNAVDDQKIGEVGDFISFHRGAAPLAFPGENEALINTGLAEALSLKAGDTLELRDDGGVSMELTVSGVYDNYIYNNIYISTATYAAHTGGDPDINYALVLKDDSVTTGEALAAILRMDDVLTASASEDLRERIGNMMASLIYIVLLTIVCAAALAFVVIYNLTNINIQERLREIATVKVLGFFDMESALYVLRENILLTVLGAAAGVPLGLALNAYVMGEIKIDLIHFVPRVHPMSYVWSIALTILFSLLVDGIMFLRLRHINPAEALKAAE